MPSSSSETSPIVSLQQSIGNKSVQHLYEAGHIQAALRISQPGDQHERTAEQIAEQFVKEPEPTVAVEDSKDSPESLQQVCATWRRRNIQRKPLNCTDCEKHAQRKHRRPGENQVVDSTVEQQVLSGQTDGRPLPSSVRSRFESRFGVGFSDVRIHTGSDSDEAARSIDAEAFTHGQDIVFRSGAYRPRTEDGKRLLAHELTHVVQQQMGRVSQHRVSRQTETESTDEDEADEVERKDLVLKLSEDEAGRETAKAVTISPDAERIRVRNLEEMAEALRQVSFQIDRLIFLSHSLPSGDLGFQTGSGSTVFERPETIANELRDTVPSERGPNLLDFRGCSLGTSPSGLDAIRNALHAGAAIGSNCFIITQVNGPIVLGNTKITQASQVTERNREAFEEGLQMLRKSFKPPTPRCILDDSESAYFRANGKFVAMWTNPTFENTWDQRKSVCYADLTTETVDPEAGDQDPGIAGHCKLIRVEEEERLEIDIDFLQNGYPDTLFE